MTLPASIRYGTEPANTAFGCSLLLGDDEGDDLFERLARRRRRLAIERAASLVLAPSSASVAATCAAIAFATRPPSRAVLRPTRSLAWIAVVPS